MPHGCREPGERFACATLAGMALPPGWSELLEEYSAHLRAERGLSPHTVRAYVTDLKDLASVRSALVDGGVKVKDAELRYIANAPVEIADPEIAQKLFKVLDALDDLDDVVNVHTNADITADIE